MRIDCRECVMYGSEHCDDCLVSAVLHPPSGAVEIDDALDASLAALSGAGLIPVLRFRRSAPVPAEGAPPSEEAG